MGRHLSPPYVRWYWSADTVFWQLSTDYNIDVQPVFSWAVKQLESLILNIGCPVMRTDGRSVYGHVITVEWVDLLS